MNIIEKPISDLIPYNNNPRINDEAVPAVAASIKDFGFKVPIIIDKDNVIIAGHTRLKAAIKLELKTVPCIVADDLSEEQIRAFRIADNKVSELATWDLEKLELELSQLNDFQMFDYGFNESNENTVDNLADNIDEIEDELQDIPKAKFGEIYKLDNHFLMCGDATNKEDIEKLINNAHIDLALTDPPYGIDIVGGAKSEALSRLGAAQKRGTVGGGI